MKPTTVTRFGTALGRPLPMQVEQQANPSIPLPSSPAPSTYRKLQRAPGHAQEGAK